MSFSKNQYLALIVALLLLSAGFFPVFTWQLYGQTGELKAELVFNIFQLEYYDALGTLLSEQENAALAWLTFGISALMVGTLFLLSDKAVQHKMIRTSTLLSGAQIFSMIVTAVRAGNGLEAAQLNPTVGFAMISSLSAFLILLYLTFTTKVAAEVKIQAAHSHEAGS